MKIALWDTALFQRGDVLFESLYPYWNLNCKIKNSADKSSLVNPFGGIGGYSRPLVDRYCRLWST